MKVRMPVDVRLEVDAARECNALVPVYEVAEKLAMAFHDEGGLIRLMLAHVVMTECAKFGYPMKIATSL